MHGEGCKALQQSLGGGVHTEVLSHGMTRAPVLRVPSLRRAVELKEFLEDPAELVVLAKTFASTSRFARLANIRVVVAGMLVYVRCTATTGDAMGMNMISKGVEKVMAVVLQRFPDVRLLSLSGNVCTDKKSSMMNWIEGRGTHVIAVATIPPDVVKQVLKTTVEAMVELNYAKNLVGSAMAGTIGGYNAHAANLVTALFMATGQDVAQVVDSCTFVPYLSLSRVLILTPPLSPTPFPFHHVGA